MAQRWLEVGCRGIRKGLCRVTQRKESGLRVRGRLAEEIPRLAVGSSLAQEGKVRASESTGNGLSFLREAEEGPGVRTRSAWP